MKKLLTISLLITLAAGLFTGCSKKKGEPPLLPPAGSMTIDFSDFITVKKSAYISERTTGFSAVENGNWTAASTIAGIWNTILAVNLAVPVASFKLAINNNPVFVDTKKWEWNYSATVLGGTYNARLTGQIRSSDVKWEMYISRQGIGAFSEFLWFEGTSALDGKSGQWILNHSKEFPEPMLQIDWTVTGTSLASIKYTYVRDLKNDRSSDPFKTSYIQYGKTTSSFDAYYTVHLNLTGAAGVFEDINIEWSTTSHSGHIKAPYYFTDILWHCWDGNGNDVVCN
jgi:hypothetical protein